MREDLTWWPAFWKGRWRRYFQEGEKKNVLNFASIDPVNDDNGQDIFSVGFNGISNKFINGANEQFDAIIFHSSINKNPDVKDGDHPDIPKGKAGSIIGSGWAVKEWCIDRWSELYRVSKPNAVWFISCYKHVDHHYRVEEWLTDEDRHNKTIRVEGW